jgi:sporulenol synthase
LGKSWLYKNQEKDGSWYGRWGICYIYGTWAALTGLKAAGVSGNRRAITKASRWLKEIQNPDGGWGESCKSDSAKRYIPLQASTLTQTAWATDALISLYERPTKEINEGIQFIIDHLNKEDWTTDYPKGQGMAGDFYLHYHSYRYIFPLLALAHYQEKYS